MVLNFFCPVYIRLEQNIFIHNNHSFISVNSIDKHLIQNIDIININRMKKDLQTPYPFHSVRCNKVSSNIYLDSITNSILRFVVFLCSAKDWKYMRNNTSIKILKCLWMLVHEMHTFHWFTHGSLVNCSVPQILKKHDLR